MCLTVDYTVALLTVYYFYRFVITYDDLTHYYFVYNKIFSVVGDQNVNVHKKSFYFSGRFNVVRTIKIKI